MQETVTVVDVVLSPVTAELVVAAVAESILGGHLGERPGDRRRLLQHQRHHIFRGHGSWLHAPRGSSARHFPIVADHQPGHRLGLARLAGQDGGPVETLELE